MDMTGTTSAHGGLFGAGVVQCREARSRKAPFFLYRSCVTMHSPWSLKDVRTVLDIYQYFHSVNRETNFSAGALLPESE